MTEEPMRAEVVRRLPPQAVSLIEMPEDEFSRMKGIATSLAQAGVFRDARQAPIVFAKMVIGRELGLGIGQSMLGLHLVEGGVMMHYSTMLACVRARGWKYRIPEHTIEKCRIQWIDPDGEMVGETEYVIDDAVRAEIVERRDDGALVTKQGKKSMYQKVPKNMLLARAVSNGVKAYVPEAMGGMPVYVEGELPSSQAVDGVPGGSFSERPETSLSAVAEGFPEDLRDRFYAAYGEASELRPGSLSPAVVQMSVAGQPREAVEAFLDQVEAENAAARAGDEVPDAEVVDVGSADVEALRVRLSGLLDRRTDVEENPSDVAETQAALEALDAEIEHVEGLLRDAGGEVPGQEAMQI